MKKKPADVADALISRAGDDLAFRERLLARPKETIEAEFGVTMADGQEIHVHEESYSATHVVLPPRSKYTREERRRRGRARHPRVSPQDHARPRAAPSSARASRGARPSSLVTASAEALAEAGRDSIRRGLGFLESTIDENGAWHCIRFNVADPNVPRHYEKTCLHIGLLRPCPGTLRGSAGQVHLRRGQGLSRRRHRISRILALLPTPAPGSRQHHTLLAGDRNAPLDTTGRNVPRILANRDQDGRFMTWILEGDEPDVVSRFRIEADPVVNANVIAYLGDRPETRDAQRWLEALITEGNPAGSSKWYPDEIAIYYAIARAVTRVRPALDQLRPILAARVLGLRDDGGDFGNILQTAQAVSVLHEAGCLEGIDARRQVERSSVRNARTAAGRNSSPSATRR